MVWTAGTCAEPASLPDPASLPVFTDCADPDPGAAALPLPGSTIGWVCEPWSGGGVTSFFSLLATCEPEPAPPSVLPPNTTTAAIPPPTATTTPIARMSGSLLFGRTAGA